MITGQSLWIRPTFSMPGMSALVNRRTTPGTAAAALMSIAMHVGAGVGGEMERAVEHAVDAEVVDVVLLPHREVEAPW